MSKEVTVEWLIAHPREFVEDVQRGESVRIVDGEKIIGTVEPPPARGGVPYPFRDFDFGRPLRNLAVDVTDVIREDRDSELEKHGL
jgi:hypothetical protein